jgi:hypothetical protein
MVRIAIGRAWGAVRHSPLAEIGLVRLTEGALCF